MVLGSGRRQQQQQQHKQTNPLDQKRQRQDQEQQQDARRRQQQKQQEPSSSSSSDEDDFEDEGDEGFGGLTEDQMMQMMMGSRRGRTMLGSHGDDGAGDEYDGIEDFPMMDDEGDDGFDYEGFDEEDDDDEGDFDDEDDDDDDAGQTHNSYAKHRGKQDPRIQVLNSSSSDDDEEDNTNTEDNGAVHVNFSVDNMVQEDIPKVASHLENYFPDPEKSTVDVATLSKAIFHNGLGTSVVLAQQENNTGDDNDDEEDDEDEVTGANLNNDDDPEQEFYGVLSLITANFLDTKKLVKPLENGLLKDVLSHLSGPTAVHPISLLSSGASGKSALVVSELFSQLPPELISRLYTCFIEEVESNGGSNKKTPSAAAVPQHVVLLSKVTSANAKSQDKTPLSASAQNAKKYSNEKTSAKPTKRAARVVDDAKPDGDEFVTFLRFEEDLFYRNRDSVGTQVARGRFNNDPNDNRRCLCYALTWKNFKSAVGELSILNK